MTVRARCRDGAGHPATDSLRFKYDDTAPTVRAILGRRPDLYGWYAKDVRVCFAGRDAVSGVGQLLVQGLPGPGHGARLRHRLVPGPRGKPTQPHALVQVLEAVAAAPSDARGSRRRRSSTGWTFAGTRVQRSGLARRAQDPQSVAGQVEIAARPWLEVPGRVAQVDARRALHGVRVAAFPEGLRGAAQPGRVHLRRGVERGHGGSSGGRTRTCDTRIMIPGRRRARTRVAETRTVPGDVRDPPLVPG